MLAAAPDGTLGLRGLRRPFGFGVLHPADRLFHDLRLPHRRGARGNGKEPSQTSATCFDLETFPGKRSLEKRPINNMEWALLCDGVAKEDVYDVLETDEGQDQALAKLDTIKDDVIWWSAGAETPQLLADGEICHGFDL
jgi:putative spermidine/putrescine transport system substrate-binding protein